MEEKKVIAIVVTYNRKELLKECIEALLDQDYKNCDVLVIDNASTDGTQEFIKRYIDDKKIFYRNTGENLGGAGGFNYGLKEAYKIGCDFMWLMDDDCIVKKDSLTKFIEVDKELNGNYGFLSSKVLWKDDSICKMNIQKKNIIQKVDEWDIDKQKIIMATFVSFFVKRDIVKKVGLPIKDFFIWADDLEYSRRISKMYKCYLINKSVVIHKSKNNIGSNIAVDTISNLKRYSYAYRNEMYIYKREGILGRFYFLLKVILHKVRIKKTDKSENEKKEKVDVINKAVADGKIFNPKIEYVEANNE